MKNWFYHKNIVYYNSRFLDFLNELQTQEKAYICQNKHYS